MSHDNSPPTKVRELQRNLYTAAKQSPNRRFHALYDRIHRMDVLREAWRQVKANHGSAGIDGQTIDEIVAYGEERFLLETHAELRTKKYRARSVRRVYIPKSDGKTRPLGIPAVKDRVVQMAAKIVIEPLFEADFEACSFGFRPRRSATEALERLRITANGGYDWVLDADIEKFFDTIDHGILMQAVQRRISDRRVLRLIRGWLKAGVIEDGELKETLVGTPQGGVISPLLANVYLHAFDRYWQENCRMIGVLTRYADDFVIQCRNESCAREALRRVQAFFGKLKLKLHPEKTRVVNVRKQGIDFLGCHLRKLCSWRSGRWYLYRWPNRKAMARIRSRIRKLTERHGKGGAELKEVVARLTPVLRGWGNYFRSGNATKQFSKIDRYVFERLRIYAHRKRPRENKPRWRRWYDSAWYTTLRVYRLNGTIRYPGCANAG